MNNNLPNCGFTSTPRTFQKDYSDDIVAFQYGLKKKSTLDLQRYLPNLINKAAQITGDDEFANALFEKLHERAFFVKQELDRRAPTADKTTLAERKRKLDELYSGGRYQEGPYEEGACDGDPPIESRPTPLAPKPSPIRPLVPKPAVFDLHSFIYECATDTHKDQNRANWFYSRCIPASHRI